MFEPEIKEKLQEKFEYDFYFFKECFLIYLKLLLLDDSREIREKFIIFIRDYYNYSLNEYQILLKIKNTKYHESLEDMCLDLIDKMEYIFLKLFHYNEYILSGYEDAITCKDIKRATILKREFDIISNEEKNEFIKKLKLYK